MRIDRRDGELIDRTAEAKFRFDGRSVTALGGDTIGSALAAKGIRTLSRSFKYHRRRGLVCMTGKCPNCLVTVDGTPNVRACTTRVESGMDVRSQNVWPSLERDILSVLNWLSFLMPAGFYYKFMHRPKGLWDVVRPFIRKATGLGAINPDSANHAGYTHRSMHAGVLVVGGGPAGAAAAAAAGKAGASVVLVDEQPLLGAGRRPGEAEQITAVASVRGVEILSGATAFGLYAGNLTTVLYRRELLLIRADAVVLATGAQEVPMLFPGNDLPGVMLASGALRLLRMYGVLPGKRAVVATLDDSGYEAAGELAAAGMEVVAILDARPDAKVNAPDGVTRVESDVGVVSAKGGSGGLRSIRFAGSGGRGRIRCDVLLMAGRRQSAAKLAWQAECGSAFSPSLGAPYPIDPPDGLHLAGNLVGILDPAEVVEDGRLAGEAAASGLSVPHQPVLTEVAHTPSPANGPRRGDKVIICLCEDVTPSDVRSAVREGFGDIQTLKRYTTATMGPCQGGMCARNFTEAAVSATNGSLPDSGLTTQRPPALPVPMGALAGPGLLPVKRTALDHVHVQLGATMVEAGGWQRPHNYGDAIAEAANVRERVGMIDVSSLGKIELEGPQTHRLLDILYTNVMSTLRVGRVRYGIMCLDQGIAMDDGTVTRLDETRYLVTTTTGNVEPIEQWYRWWMATRPDLSGRIANVTAGLAAINVAGPLARATLSGLTDADLSPKAFPYMRSKKAKVADVDSILMRIGFVGETGWEIHFPAQYAEHVWRHIAEAGAEHGIRPFGLEAQRILRLEKGHVIIHQDTDSTTTPIELGMDWAVKFSKPDFIGRGGLAGVARRGPRHLVVGFVMDAESPVPPDGAPVVDSGAPVGRVTSARLSPTKGHPFGLVMIPRGLAQEGESMRVLIGGELWPATVRLKPLYDPAGERLRA